MSSANNPGPTNGGGLSKAASGVVDALKTSPLELGLIVLTLIFFYFVYSGVQANRKDIHEIMKVMVEKCINK